MANEANQDSESQTEYANVKNKNGHKVPTTIERAKLDAFVGDVPEVLELDRLYQTSTPDDVIIGDIELEEGVIEMHVEEDGFTSAAYVNTPSTATPVAEPLWERDE